MVLLFQNKSFSRVQQNDHLSSNIQSSHGCREGNPLLSYIFIICSEILAEVVRGCDGVRGIEVMELD